VFFVQGLYDYDFTRKGRTQSVAQATGLTQFSKCVSEKLKRKELYERTADKREKI
jgi:hypothetical protein